MQALKADIIAHASLTNEYQTEVDNPVSRLCVVAYTAELMPNFRVLFTYLVVRLSCVAGTVLQVVESGSKVVKIAIEYAQGGGTTHVTAIETYVRTLITATSHLVEKLNVSNDTTAPGPARALSLANKQCLSISQELVTLLQSLKLESIGWWKVAKSTLREFRAQQRLQELCSRLENAKSNLAVCFMVYTVHRDKQREEDGMTTSYDIRASVEVELKLFKDAWKNIPKFNDYIPKLTEAIDQSNRGVKLEERITKLTEIVAQISERIDTYNGAVPTSVGSLDRLVKRLSNRLEQKFCTDPQLEHLSADANELQVSLRHELRTINLLTESLAFGGMNDRMMGIKRAHMDTYIWIFRRNVNLPRIWDNFVSWLHQEEGQSMYWIRGKPGSGKSTLIREMHEVMKSNSSVTSWRDKAELLVLCSYFYYAGIPLQRSLTGLLHNLVHQLLQQRPGLVRCCVPQTKWDRIFLHSIDNSVCWSIEELKETLHKLVEHISDDTVLLLLIDGLDEFDGDDDERLNMIEFLESLTKTGIVKICVSSRPWNIFKDAFENRPQLCLEDLTRDDIEKFVSDTFLANRLFQRKLGHDSALLQKLTAQVADRAEGVFLWVDLVVRDLVKAVRDGSPTSHLHRILEGIPRDLDNYFVRILHQIEPEYRRDAATILKLKLCDMSYKSILNNDVRNSPLLRLCELLDLDDDYQDAYFLLNHTNEWTRNHEYYRSTMREQYDSLERRLASRSMGLLEISRSSQRDHHAEILYLHRTVADFLCTPRAQAELDKLIDQSFNPIVFRCQSLLGCIMTANVIYDIHIQWLECFLHWAQSSQVDTEQMLLTFVKATSMVDSIAFCGFQKVAQKERRLFWSLAIQHGWKAAIKHIASNAAESDSINADILLDLALRPYHPIERAPDREIIAFIYSLRANPEIKVVPCRLYIGD